MAQANKTTIEVTEEQKETLKGYQSHLEEKLGTKPTQGETMAIACERATAWDKREDNLL